ncbi:MAG: TonB-dependent receptor [Spirochaetia bacterium]|nr:TonB-dependent receptor [Spirochaetia bacterium]
MILGNLGNSKGIEFNNNFMITPHLTLIADFSISRAKYIEFDTSGDTVPLSARNIFYTAINYSTEKWGGSLNYRYFGPRPLTEDDTVKSSPAGSVSGMLSATIYDNWILRMEIFNLLNSKIDRIQYSYPTRLKYEPIGPDEGGYSDRVVSPYPGRNFRISVSHNF